MESQQVTRKLPSADWIAFGVGLLGIVFIRNNAVILGGIGLAAIGPSLLREIGVLKDSDEWQRGVMHRAGFQACLVIGFFLAFNMVYQRILGTRFPGTNVAGSFFNMSFLWIVLVGIFVVSYLVQYWGAARGVSRIIAGLGVITFLNAVTPWWNINPPSGPKSVALAGSVLLFLLAWTIKKWPRPAGILLLVLTGVYPGIGV